MEKKTFTIGIVVLALVTAIVIGGMSSSVMAQTPGVIRVLPSDTQTAGSLIMVSLDVVVDSGTYYVIDEEVPAGWTVTNASEEGDYTTTPGHIFWTKLSSATDTTLTYTVTIPGAAVGDYTFAGTYMMEGMTAETTIGGDIIITAGSEPVLTPTPRATPSPTPKPTLTPTIPPPVTTTPTLSPSPSPTPTTPTPLPSPTPPGFEAVFAVAGLLAVAYLVLRRKKQ